MAQRFKNFKHLMPEPVQSPRMAPGPVRSRLQVEAALAPGAVPSAARDCRAVALDWVQRQLGRNLPWQARFHRPFAVRTDGVSVSAVRFRDEFRDRWAVRIERTPEPDKRATIDFAVADDDAGTPSVSLTVHDRSVLPMVWNHYPARALAAMAERAPLVQEGRPLIHSSVVVESDAEMDAFVKRLVDRDRDMPFVVISIPSDGPESAPLRSSWDSLARTLTGLAVVWVLPTAMTYRLSDAVGKGLSAYLGAWRFYRPGFQPGASQTDHPLVLGRHLVEEGAFARISREFLQLAAEERMRTGFAEDGPLDYDAIAGKSESAASGPARLVSFVRGFVRGKPPEPPASEPSREPMPESATASALRRKLASAKSTAKANRKRYRREKKRAERAERERKDALERAERLVGLVRALGGDPDAKIPFPISWDEFADWCAENLSGRVALADSAKRELRKAEFEDVGLAARCLAWLAGEYRDGRLQGGDPHLRGPIVGGVHNEPCGGDAFECMWEGRTRTADWHIKHANTHDPRRCLRIYYFWDDRTRQAVVASMPAHR